MKIRYGSLKQIIREVALSPGIFKNGEFVHDPLDDKEIAGLIQRLENAFKRTIGLNLLLMSSNAYDASTREFDDETYKAASEIASDSTEKMVAGVGRAVSQTWTNAHNQFNQQRKR